MAHLKHVVLGEGRQEPSRSHSTDIFGPVEENNVENIEEEVEEEEEEEEEPEEEEEKKDDTSRSEEEGEADNDDKTEPWNPLRQKFGEYPKMPFSTPCYL